LLFNIFQLFQNSHSNALIALGHEMTDLKD